ncbi:MAG: metal ABC transporter ATP-binding protein [Halanaerobiales bacterium]
MAYVPQTEDIDWDYPVRVRDVVLAGRYGQILSSDGYKKFLPTKYFATDHLLAVKKALADVDMLAYKNKPIGALSGGQKKRVFLARALAQNAELFLLDEPLVGVDQNSTELIMRVLSKMKDCGKTILMISHNINKIQQYTQKIVLLNKTIIAVGPTNEILNTRELNTIYNIKTIERNKYQEIRSDHEKIKKEENFLIKKQSDEVLPYVE